MTRNQRITLIIATGVVGVGLLSISVYLGLDRADKIASILSAIFGLSSLLISAQQAAHHRNSNTAESSPKQSQRGGDNSTNIQGGGSITIGDNNRIGRDR
ncbi:hypothetical protein [Streptomyces sp. CBMAI 2042]|uniref:hypothetical protein n=1 Tax=Streptomyces sp. CBMAI 2042 TaxID=2305222 RepID=UPI001F180B07|nr:hypothetical protein [Streptomyces sp. CBMAI 2042]